MKMRTILGTSIAACGLIWLLCACSSPSEPPSDTPGVRGTLAVYVVDLDDGTSELRYGLVQGDHEQPLLFDADPDLTTGAAVEVWGDDTPAGLHVTRWARSNAGVVEQALIGAPAYPNRSFAFVLVDVGGDGGVNLTADAALAKITGTASGSTSAKQYFLEASYQTQDVTGQVFGPLSYPMTTCDTRGLATTLRAQVPTGFDHYLWYMGSKVSACSWSGLASVGSPDKPSRDTWFNASSSMTVLVHEPGHNFGMMHSSSMTCGTVPFVDVPEGTCTHSEYGDSYDVMGRGAYHSNAWQKVYQSWLLNCNSVRVSSSGTFTLLPLEVPCNGIQVLQIPAPKVRPFTRSGGGGSDTTENLAYYYLELRTKTGIDSRLSVAPTVLVHVAEDYRNRTQSGRHTWILDMNPADTTLNGLGAGQSFTDPAGGVTFTVQAISAASATVNVEIAGGTGAPTCLDGTTLTPPGPADCGGGGAATGGTTATGGTGTGGRATGGARTGGARTGGARTGGANAAGGAPAGGLAPVTGGNGQAGSGDGGGEEGCTCSVPASDHGRPARLALLGLALAGLLSRRRRTSR